MVEVSKARGGKLELWGWGNPQVPPTLCMKHCILYASGVKMIVLRSYNEHFSINRYCTVHVHRLYLDTGQVGFQNLA